MPTACTALQDDIVQLQCKQISMLLSTSVLAVMERNYLLQLTLHENGAQNNYAFQVVVLLRRWFKSPVQR